MDSMNNGRSGDQIVESDCPKSGVRAPNHAPTPRRALLTIEKPQRRSFGSFPGFGNGMNFLKLDSPSAKFKQLANDRDEVSRSVGLSSSHNLRARLSAVFPRKIEWISLMKMAKEWIRNPINMALFLWITAVAVSGAILFMVMTGMLNNALPKKSQRDSWFEISNQILNALFTLMALYHHPKRFHHLVLLSRWKPEDISRLRKIYCKNGTYKPHEWAHMIIVVILLHINCFAQYALCGLNVGYRRSNRPAIGVGITITLAIGAGAFAGLYTVLSPLGKDYDVDEESQVSSVQSLRSLQRRYSFASAEEDRTIVHNPKWSGGILDIWQDLSLAYLSLFCTFCVFGWNMERLGFGNMYVHIATFILFCIAPFWIFNLAAVNVDNETVRGALGFTGVILCIFGLLYGGFWRIKMRKRYHLPGYNFCCGRPAVADCTLWLFCCWCALAQEARTGNAYDIVEKQFCQKQGSNSDRPPITPLPREDGVYELKSGPASPIVNVSSPSNHCNAKSPSPSRFLKELHSPNGQPDLMHEETYRSGTSDGTLKPPLPALMCRESI